MIEPSGQALMQSDLAAMYDPNSPSFHHWLTAGEFARLFAPSSAETTSVRAYLQAHGLTIEESASPFLVAAYGTTARRRGCFRHPDPGLPLGGRHRILQQLRARFSPGHTVGLRGRSRGTRRHLFAAPDAGPPAGPQRQPEPRYGAGPYGSGLTPSQTRSLYGANALFNTGVDGQGHGVVSAVFELSGYANSDDVHWLHYFYGPHLQRRHRERERRWRSLTPQVPQRRHLQQGTRLQRGRRGDRRHRTAADDRPGPLQAHRLQRSERPEGQTATDEYLKIASDDKASTISTSWGECEPDEGAGAARAENIAFTQMAMQGQAIFAAAGDDGAFDCLQDGTSNAHKVAVDDPGSQPWVTSAGGSSFAGYDPGVTRLRVTRRARKASGTRSTRVTARSRA